MWVSCLKLYQGQFTYKRSGRHDYDYISTSVGACLLLECEHKQDERHHKLVSK